MGLIFFFCSDFEQAEAKFNPFQGLYKKNVMDRMSVVDGPSP
jgi:hypothetical protein